MLLLFDNKLIPRLLQVKNNPSIIIKNVELIDFVSLSFHNRKSCGVYLKIYNQIIRFSYRKPICY